MIRPIPPLFFSKNYISITFGEKITPNQPTTDNEAPPTQDGNWFKLFLKRNLTPVQPSKKLREKIKKIPTTKNEDDKKI